jgi:acetolactate synthase-1/2/3 large subunit
MPGGEVVVLLDALESAGVRFVLCKHENNAGYMAEGAWQATGAPGILLTTIGPGLANAVNTIANAFQEQVPLIVLSGCIDRAEAESFTHQVIDQSALLAPVTKAQFRVAEGTAPAVIDKAIAIAMTDPPGPVHVDLPHNLAATAITECEISALAAVPGLWPGGPSRKQAVKLLENSHRPILVAGLGAIHHHAGPAIKDLCERFSMPFVTTYKAKGVVAENHPLCLGGHGLSPLSDRAILPLLQASDCVVLAGYDPIEMRDGWRHPWDPQVAIEICHCANHHGMHGSAVRFVGDVAGALQQLNDSSAVSGNVWVDQAPQRAKAELAEAFACRTHWGPHQVFDTMQQHLPDDAVVTIDAGAHRILLTQMWRCNRPGSLLQSSAFCTMGISLPLAAGFKHAAPASTVVAVMGDAGLEMIIGEMATLRDQKINLIIVVLVDESLALIELKQRRSELPNAGVDFGGTDFVALAQAYGGYGAWVDDVDSLARELGQARDTNTFTILACRIAKTEYDGAF